MTSKLSAVVTSFLFFRRLAFPSRTLSLFIAVVALATLLAAGTAHAQTFVLGHAFAVEGPGAGSDSVVLSATPATVSWSAASNAGWIHVAAGSTSGVGSAIVSFNFDTNFGGERIGIVSVAGQTLTVTQAGATFNAVTQGMTLVSSGLNLPYSVAADAAGNVYFVDTYNSALKVWKAATQTVFTLVSSGLNKPSGLALDALGNVYIADTNSAAIREWNATTQQLSTLVSTGLNQPQTVALDAAGNVYIADSGNNAIKVWKAATQQVSTLVSSGLNFPVGVAVDVAGNVYIADTLNSAIKVWKPVTQQVSTLVSSELNNPYDVAVDGSGNLYIADSFNNAIKVWTPATQQVSTLSTPNLNSPFGVAIDATGNVYIADSFDSAIKEVARAFVDTAPRSETYFAGSDSISVLPLSQRLVGALAPSSDQNWLTIQSVANGGVSFSFTDNTGPARTAHLTILGQSVAITQGAPYVLGITEALQGPGASTGSVTLSVPLPSDAWTATSNAPWIHLAAGATNGTGSADVVYTLDANSGATRIGTISLGGQTLTVTQAGATFTRGAQLSTIVTGLNNPYGIAVDIAGNVYIADTGNNAIKEWNAVSHDVSTLVSSGLSNPYDVAVDAAGNVYIADSGHNAIKLWNATTRQISTLVSGNFIPHAVAVDRDGNVYFDDASFGRIEKWSAATQQTSVLIPDFSGGLALDNDGNIYIASAGNSAVEEWNVHTGETLAVVASGLSSPRDVSVDGAGNLYILDTGHRAIKERDAFTQQVSTLISGLGYSEGIAVDETGNVYFSDFLANSIRKLVRTFVDTSARLESAAAGSEFISVLPLSQSLSGEFAPASDSPWLTVGQCGDGVVSFAYTQNLGPTRVGHLTILGQTITITQEQAAYFFASSTMLLGPDASTGSVLLSVQSPTGAWTADSDSDWLHLTQASTSGTGSAMVSFTVDANTGATRTGKIVIAGQVLTVTQAGAVFAAVTHPSPLFVSGDFSPSCVAVDFAGNVYFSDSFDTNGAIKTWNATTQQVSTLVFGVPYPTGVAVDAVGNVYFAEQGSNAIHVWNATTQQTSILVSSGLTSPNGIAVDSVGNVYIADRGNNTIKEWNAATQQLSTVVSSGLFSPFAVAVDAIGNLYIADTGNDAIKEWNVATQQLSTLVSSGLDHPYGVAVDAGGNVYIADAYHLAIKEWSAATQQLSVLCSGSSFVDVAVDASGNLYIVDSDLAVIDELPHALIGASTVHESSNSGSDSIALLPASINLQGLFAPTSNQDWLTIGTTTEGAVDFSFTRNVSNSPRSAELTILGQTISVTQAALPLPIATNLTVFANSGAPAKIDVLAHASAPSGLPLYLISVTGPSRGRISINGDYTLTYTPTAPFTTFSGGDTFFYTVGDGYGTVTAQVTVRNPFYPAKGIYNGLVTYAGGAQDALPGGYFSLTLTGAGGFTGTMKLGTSTHAFKGSFALDGTAMVTINLPGKPAPAPITLSLLFDEANASQVTGNFSLNGQNYLFSTGAHEIYNGATNPDPSAGYYTVRLPAPPAPAGAAATASATVSNGRIAGISVTDGGSGYIAVPRVTIAGATGKGATAAAIVSGGVVTEIAIRSPGSGYSANGVTITIDPPSAGLPGGTGWATMTVSEGGAVKLAGKLGDGTAFSTGALISTAEGVDSFTFYLPLYAKGKTATPGSIAGAITFQPGEESDCDGSLEWAKPAQPFSTFYPGGFHTEVTFEGARYTMPKSGSALRVVNQLAMFEFSGGNFTSPVFDQLTISARNAVTETSSTTDRLKLSINAKAGLLSGSFVPVPKGPANKISGVLYQKLNIGAGQFLGKFQTGAVELLPY